MLNQDATILLLLIRVHAAMTTLSLQRAASQLITADSADLKSLNFAGRRAISASSGMTPKSVSVGGR
jgi:hypothetical protein